jgi:hypothetical protein
VIETASLTRAQPGMFIGSHIQRRDQNLFLHPSKWRGCAMLAGNFKSGIRISAMPMYAAQEVEILRSRSHKLLVHLGILALLFSSFSLYLQAGSLETIQTKVAQFLKRPGARSADWGIEILDPTTDKVVLQTGVCSKGHHYCRRP